jgi:undecaprenyl-diphosphatase
LGTVLNQFLKILCRVPRPWVKDPNFTIVESAREAATGYSFPSGHTQTAVGLFGGVARTTKQRWVCISMIVLAALVALSRMYLGVHTPADVLVSLGIAVVLIFALHPLFHLAERSPRVMYGILFGFLALMVAYLCFIHLFPFPEEVYAADAIHNLESARKNGYTLMGCAVGLLVIYTADQKWLHFRTDAIWWAQILKAVGGLGAVVAVKELLRAPLDAIFNGHLAARSVRYFLMVVVGGILWPMTFGFFAKLGKKEK